MPKLPQIPVIPWQSGDNVFKVKHALHAKYHLATLDVHDVMSDGGVANGRDVDDQRMDLSMDSRRHNNGIIAAAIQHKRNMHKTKKKLFSCYVPAETQFLKSL